MVYTYTKNAEGHFVCPHCACTKKNQNTMHYHLKTHEGKLPFVCSHCTKQFLHASTLELHKKAQHQEEHERMFKCPVAACPFEGTLTKSNLLIHYVRRHCKEEAGKLLKMGADGPECLACNKSSKSLTGFYYHSAGCMTLEDGVRQGQLDAIRA